MLTFYFPSWHEGFGLPALEAMRCGAPVIASNTSSLPEVIGWDEALFDPYSESKITSAMERALTDESYRKDLIAHGKRQSRCFSWSNSATVAIAAMEKLVAERRKSMPVPEKKQQKLAYVSPLPPDKSGYRKL